MQAAACQGLVQLQQAWPYQSYQSTITATARKELTEDISGTTNSSRPQLRAACDNCCANRSAASAAACPAASRQT